MKEVIIIGGGASGLMTACLLSDSCPNVKVTIVERLEKIGKKILATGNGKCNFTNMDMYQNHYNHPRFVEPLLEQFNNVNTIDYFNSLGLMSKELAEGRVYPNSENASSVLEILRYRLNKNNVSVKTNFEVNKIAYKDNKFQLYNKNQRNYFIEADYIVVATGGNAAQILGSNGSGYSLLKGFKIKCTDIYPGLVGLKADPLIVKPLNGVRYKCRVNVLEKKTKERKWFENGEVQFKDDGISGICVMNAASYIYRHPLTYCLSLDLLPNMKEEEILKLLQERKTLFNDLESQNLLTGILPKMLGLMVIKRSNINLTSYIKDLNNQNLKKITSILKQFIIDIKGDYGFDKAQVTVGGININEVNKDTLELKNLPNAYITGELLDVDGDCGGYNLQWAFTSAYIVSKDLATKLCEEPVKKTKSKGSKKDE